jgi:hypothetical protein
MEYADRRGIGASLAVRASLRRKKIKPKPPTASSLKLRWDVVPRDP